ncbi:MAG: Quinohemoprotein alcohol dehydrogenase precursor [Pseudomonadota bacterium]|jgi:outer membrane protein assembly factor BamB
MRRLGWLVLAPTLVAADWPQFLGPTRDGASSETGISRDWLADAPRVRWRARLGFGYASTAVAGGVAYTAFADASGDHVRAITAADGRTLWTTRIDAPWIDPGGYSGPRTTPTVLTDRVIAASATGQLVALDRATGRRLWSVDLVQDLGGGRPVWGYAGSPLVENGRIHVDVGGAAGVVALNAADGRLLWSRPGTSAGYASPILTKLGGQTQVVHFTATGPLGVAPDSGSLLWSLPWRTSYDVNAATPVVLPGDRLFVASGYGVGGAMFRVAEAPLELWRSKSMKNRMATSVRLGDRLLGFNEDRFAAVDLATGAVAWEATGYGRGSVITADGHAIVYGEDCRVHLIADAPTGPDVRAGWAGDLSGPCWTSPALSNGTLYLRDADELVALDL